MGCCDFKVFMWLSWMIVVVVSVIYGALAANSINLIRGDTNSLFDSKIANASYTMNAMSFLSVAFWIIWSLLILMSRFFGDVKLMYGVMLGVTVTTAWFVLAAGVVQQSFEPVAIAAKDRGAWTQNNWTAFRATYVFAYILAALYLLEFFLLMAGRKSYGKMKNVDMGQQQSLGRMSQQPVNAYVDMGTMERGGMKSSAAV